MDYEVLGGLAITHGGRPLALGGPKQRLVLALLVLADGAPISPDRLVDLVWEDEPPDQVATSLQTYVSNLRRLLEPGRGRREEPTVLLTRPGGYSLRIERRQLDLCRFEDLVREGEALHEDGDLRGAVDRIVTALDLWAPLLPEFADVPAVQDAARRLDALHLLARERWFDLRLALGEAAAILPELGEAVRAAPLHERFRSQLALALYRSGRQTDALRALADARRVLNEEVGVDPGPELRALETDILAHAPSLDGAPHASAAAAADEVSVPPLRGREREMAVALEALELAAGGTGTAVVVSGEAGIGKTRLAEEVVMRARDRGFASAWARCPETAAASPFAAFVELADALRAQDVVDLPDPADLAGDRDPIELRRAVVAALRRPARPAVLVVDDLQWADLASLRTFEYLAGDLHQLPVLLVVTTRPPASGAPDPLVDCLAELARAASSVRIPLEGLTKEVIDRWAEERLGLRSAADVAGFVHDRSSGNPFFASELLALLDGEGAMDEGTLAALRVPDAVAHVVRRRVGRLPSMSQQLLSAASVFGSAFDLDVVAGVLGEPMAELLGALDPALDAGLVAEDASSLVGYRFSHALVAEALASELAPSRRARLHAQAVAAIERARAGQLDAWAAQLAHHALAGARAGTASAAVHWSVRAAEHAMASRAPEDAAGHYAHALRASELAAPDDLALRFRLLMAMAGAWSRSGAEERAQAALLDAVDVADQRGDLAGMVSALRSLAHPTLWQPGDYQGGDARLADRVDGVLERIGPEAEAGDRAALLGLRAALAYYSLPPAEVAALSAEAVALARRSGSPEVLAMALLQRTQAVWRPGSADERSQVATELVELVRRRGLGADLETVGRLARLVAAYERGEADDDEAAEMVAGAVAAGTALAQLEVLTFQVARLGSRGRYTDAVALASAAGELFRRTGRRNAEPSLVASIALSLIDTDQLDQLADAGGDVADPSFAVATTELFAFALAEAGRLDDARAVLGTPGLAPHQPADWLYLAVNALAGHSRAALGDEVAAAIVRARLEPHAGRVPMAGSLPLLGSVDLVLGRLADRLGDQDAALAHLDAAVAIEERMGSQAWLTRALEARAAVSGSTADRERAVAIAEEIGCRPVLRRLARAPR